MALLAFDSYSNINTKFDDMTRTLCKAVQYTTYNAVTCTITQCLKALNKWPVTPPSWCSYRLVIVIFVAVTYEPSQIKSVAHGKFPRLLLAKSAINMAYPLIGHLRPSSSRLLKNSAFYKQA